MKGTMKDLWNKKIDVGPKAEMMGWVGMIIIPIALLMSALEACRAKEIMAMLALLLGAIITAFFFYILIYHPAIFFTKAEDQ